MDSSYLLYFLQKKGLRLLAVHYDNTWNSNISTMNIRNLLKSLNIDLYTHVVNNTEADDIFKSFFLAGVPEIEASTDLALSEYFIEQLQNIMLSIYLKVIHYQQNQ